MREPAEELNPADTIAEAALDAALPLSPDGTRIVVLVSEVPGAGDRNSSVVTNIVHPEAALADMLVAAKSIAEQAGVELDLRGEQSGNGR